MEAPITHWVTFNWIVAHKGPTGRCCHDYCLLSTNGQEVPIVEKKSATQIIVHGEIKLMPIESSNLCNSVFRTGRYSADYQKRSINTNTATEDLIFNRVLPDRCALAMVSQSLWQKLTNENKHQIPALT